MGYRSLRDFFRPIRKLPSEPIVINPNEIRIWMVGHATTLINFFGTTILTDPVLVDALPFPKRLTAHGYTAEELPPLDYIIVSHVHLDHCNRRSLRKLAQKTNTIILPRACADMARKMSFSRVIELDWNEENAYPDVKVSAYRPEHWGQRFPWETRNRGYNCYVFEKNQRTIFFGGDTGYGEFFKAIGEKHSIDIALLPIGAYHPITPHHMDPEEAHQAFIDLKSIHCIPIHWGSFRLALEPMDEPRELFLEHARGRGVLERAHVLENGESFALDS